MAGVGWGNEDINHSSGQLAGWQAGQSVDFPMPTWIPLSTCLFLATLLNSFSIMSREMEVQRSHGISKGLVGLGSPMARN